MDLRRDEDQVDKEADEKEGTPIWKRRRRMSARAGNGPTVLAQVRVGTGYLENIIDVLVDVLLGILAYT